MTLLSYVIYGGLATVVFIGGVCGLDVIAESARRQPPGRRIRRALERLAAVVLPWATRRPDPRLLRAIANADDRHAPVVHPAFEEWLAAARCRWCDPGEQWIQNRDRCTCTRGFCGAEHCLYDLQEQLYGQ